MGIRRSARAGPLTGTVTMPGDKSVSHRALLLAGLARGTSPIEGLNRGADVNATRAALGSFGVAVSDRDKDVVEVEGYGRERWREPAGVVDAGNSATTARLLMGVAAGLRGQTIITGDDSLCRRPMLRVVAPLRQMGAHIDGRDHGEHLPVTVRGGTLEALEHRPDVPSAQVKSAVLLAGLAARGITTVVEAAATRDHTERMLEAAGIPVERAGRAVSLTGPAEPEARAWAVPGDLSAAMFFIVAAAIVEGSDLTIEGVGLNPTRIKALEIIKAMGADLEILPREEPEAEPRGSVRVRSSRLHGIELGADVVPAIIDELPALAVAATQAEGTTVVTGAGELRMKESDRIASLAAGLTALGASVDADDDGFAITGPTALRGGEVDPSRDHRIAMAFAVAGLMARDKVRVRNWSCVDVSFPRFADVLASTQTRRP